MQLSLGADGGKSYFAKTENQQPLLFMQHMLLHKIRCVKAVAAWIRTLAGGVL
ncbi:MAG: hypothetical protein JWQ61_884 [Collimonas fungivorans]|nr:hypothetical protein [Collimonas fungivorans]